MSMVDAKEYAKYLGIKLRGNYRTKRLKKKRFKHYTELIYHFWEKVRKRRGITSYVHGKTTVLGKPLK